MSKKRICCIVALVLISFSSGVILSMSLAEARETSINTKVFVRVESTSGSAVLRFNGLSITLVDSYDVSDFTLIDKLYPMVSFTNIWIGGVTGYVAIDFTLKIFVSKPTVRMDVAKDQEGYVYVTILGSRGELIGTFRNEAESLQTFYIPAELFR